MGNTAQTFMTQISDYKISETSFIDTYNQFTRFLIRITTVITLISHAGLKYY